MPSALVQPAAPRLVPCPSSTPTDSVTAGRTDGPLPGVVAQSPWPTTTSTRRPRAGYQCESDRARDAYARYLYGTEMTDASHFHLVIDTTAIDIDACVNLVETWARRRRPVGVSHPTSSG